MEVSQFDPCGVCLAFIDAFQQGLRLDLMILDCKECVVATPIEPVVAFMTFHCKFPDWVGDQMKSGMTLTVCDFSIERCKEGFMIVGKWSSLAHSPPQKRRYQGC